MTSCEILVAKPITTLRHLLTNVKDKDEPNNRQGAVYKIKCSDCQASYIGETGRNLETRLTEHKRATTNGDINNHIAEHHRLTNHNIDWDSAQCVTYSTNYFQRLTLESWFTNLEQTPLNRCQQLPAPCSTAQKYVTTKTRWQRVDSRESTRWCVFANALANAFSLCFVIHFVTFGLFSFVLFSFAKQKPSLYVIEIKKVA